MNTSSWIAVVLASLSAALVGCGSQSDRGASGEGPDASRADAGEDSSADSTRDAGSDAAHCASIGEACVDGGALAGQCVATWSTAQEPSTWCAQVPYARVFRASHCDGFDIVVVGATDSSSFYYYDPLSGALVGIEGHGALGTKCIAGQSPDVPLTDCYDGGVGASVSCESDGGVAD